MSFLSQCVRLLTNVAIPFSLLVVGVWLASKVPTIEILYLGALIRVAVILVCVCWPMLLLENTKLGRWMQGWQNQPQNLNGRRGNVHPG